MLYTDFGRAVLLGDGDLSGAEAHALNTRLEEEKAKRLVLQNDVDVLMRKVQQLTNDMTALEGSVGMFETFHP